MTPGRETQSLWRHTLMALEAAAGLSLVAFFTTQHLLEPHHSAKWECDLPQVVPAQCCIGYSRDLCLVLGSHVPGLQFLSNLPWSSPSSPALPFRHL